MKKVRLVTNPTFTATDIELGDKLFIFQFFFMLHCFSNVGYIDWNAKKDSLHAFAIIYLQQNGNKKK